MLSSEFQGNNSSTCLRLILLLQLTNSSNSFFLVACRHTGGWAIPFGVGSLGRVPLGYSPHGVVLHVPKHRNRICHPRHSVLILGIIAGCSRLCRNAWLITFWTPHWKYTPWTTAGCVMLSLGSFLLVLPGTQHIQHNTGCWYGKDLLPCISHKWALWFLNKPKVSRDDISRFELRVRSIIAENTVPQHIVP